MPWSFTKFREDSGITHYPFTRIHQPETHWTDPEDHAAALAFKASFLGLPDTQRYAFMTKRQDQNSRGRTLWINYFNNIMAKKWELNTRVDEVLAREGFDPYSVCRRSQTKVVSVTQFFHLSNPSAQSYHSSVLTLGLRRLPAAIPRLHWPCLEKKPSQLMASACKSRCVSLWRDSWSTCGTGPRTLLNLTTAARFQSTRRLSTSSGSVSSHSLHLFWF